MKQTTLAVLTLFSCLSETSRALESAAGRGERYQDATIEMRFDAFQAATTAAINALTIRIKVCSVKGMFYAPGETGADANGCLKSSAGKPTLTQVGNGAHGTTKTFDHDTCALSETFWSPAPGQNTGALSYQCKLTRPGGVDPISGQRLTTWGLTAWWSGMSGAGCKAICLDY